MSSLRVDSLIIPLGTHKAEQKEKMQGSLELEKPKWLTSFYETEYLLH